MHGRLFSILLMAAVLGGCSTTDGSQGSPPPSNVDRMTSTALASFKRMMTPGSKQQYGVVRAVSPPPEIASTERPPRADLPFADYDYYTIESCREEFKSG